MFGRCASSNEYPNWGFPTLFPILKPIPSSLRDKLTLCLADSESADCCVSPLLGLVARAHSSVAPVHRRRGGCLDRRGRIVSALAVQHNARLPDLSSRPPDP